MINKKTNIISILLTLVFILLINYSYSINVDSLKKTLPKLNEKAKAEGYNKIGVYYKVVSIDSALVYIQKAIVSSKKCEDSIELAKAYLTLANVYINLYKYDESEKLINNSLKIFTIKKDKLGIAKSYLIFALLNIVKGENNRNLEYTNKALKIYLQYSDKKGIAESNLNLCSYYIKKNNYKKAAECALKSLNLFEEIKDNYGIASAYNNLGIIYNLQSNSEKAIIYFEKALSYYKKTEYNIGQAQTLNNLGILYLKNNKLPEAKKRFDKSLKIYNKSKNINYINITKNNIAEYYNRINKYDSAIILYNEILTYFKKTDSKKDICITLFNISTVYVKSNKNSEALKNLNLCLPLIENIPDLKLKQLVYFSLSEVYNNLNNSEKSLEYYKLYNVICDSLYIKEKDFIASEIEQKYEYEANQQKIKLLLKQKEIQKIQEKKLYSNYVYLIIILSFLIILILFLIWMYNQKRVTSKRIKNINSILKKTNDKLIVREKELVAFNKRKDKILSIISHDLKSPVSSFTAFTKLLYDKHKTLKEDEINNYLKLINKSAKQLYDLLDNLLKWSLTQLDSAKIYPNNYCLFDIVESQIKILQNNLIEKNIFIKLDIDKETRVFIDRNMISTVFFNLITNAIKYSFSNGIIEISSYSKEGFIYVSVKDKGMGISEGNIKTILNKDEFFTTIGTSNEKGTGLGLKICMDFIELNNGQITIESKENEGANFIVMLPENSNSFENNN